MENGLKLALMGKLEIQRGGVTVAGLTSAKAQALLCYLAVTGRPHFRTSLAGLLWGDMPEANARANLRRELSALRRTVGQHLTISRQEVAFNRDTVYWLDVELFETAISQGTIEGLQEAVELYRGDFLEGYYLRDAAAFEDWVLVQATRLRELALQALHTLSVHCAELGEPGLKEGITYTSRLLALEPSREEAHRQLMLLLAQSGQRGAALAQYEVCRQALADDLDVEPGRETRELYERIRDGEIREAAETKKLPHKLPIPLIPLVGRKEELAEITARLGDPDCRLLTLIGPGGSGKTRLALEAAAQRSDCFRHGVFFVYLAPIHAADAVAPQIAQSLDFTFHAAEDPQQQLCDYLCEKNILLILDNFEHLLTLPALPVSPPMGVDPTAGDGTVEGAVNLVSTILRTAPDVKILVTSRARLGARGEHLYPVPGMDLPDQETAEDALDYGAVQLFVQSARRAQPRFEPKADDLTDVVRICRTVQGMPLALLLAASWADVLSPAEIANQIAARSINFLETDWRDVPARQRGMRAVFDHSWQLLTEPQRAVMQALSVFRGSFTSEAAEYVTSASLRDLKALVERSLLQRAPAGCYEMHELLRQYAAEKLEQSPDAGQAVYDRHSAYYVAALQRWAMDSKGPRQQEALAEIRSDSENARAAWDWAVEWGQAAVIARAMEGLCHFYDWRGRCTEGEAACQSAVEKLLPAASGEALRTLVMALAWQSHFAFRLGRTVHANRLLAQSMEILDSTASTAHDLRSEEAFVQLQNGLQLIFSDREAAMQALKQSLEFYRTLDDRWGMAEALTLAAVAARELSALDQAKQLAEESLAIRRALGDRVGMADSLNQLAYCATRAGQLEESERLVRECITIYGEMGDRSRFADSCIHLAGVSAHRGRFYTAHQLIEESAAVYSDLGMRGRSAAARSMLGWMKINLGRYEQAYALLQSNFPIVQVVGDRYRIGLAHHGFGAIALANEDYAEARQRYAESVSILRELGQREEEGRAHAGLALAARGLGELRQAEKHTYEALRLAVEGGDLDPALAGMSNVALLLADAGQVERAVELYALIARHPYFGKSRYQEDVTGKHIAAAATAMPEDAVAAAQERGRARDLWETAEALLEELRGMGWTHSD